MEPHEAATLRRSVSIPSLIAWLSLCILAAAWGQSLDQRWRSLWATAGAYGLVAAVGLGAIEKARHAHRQLARKRALRSRAELGLARLHEEGAARSSIAIALRQLRARVATFPEGQLDAGESRRSDQQDRVLGPLPLQITPVMDLDDENCALGGARAGLLREISSHNVSFTHEMPFIGRVVVLTFGLGGRRQISFVVDVMWSESTRDGFVSGGTVLDVGVPCDNEPSGDLAVPAELCTA